MGAMGMYSCPCLAARRGHGHEYMPMAPIFRVPLRSHFMEDLTRLLSAAAAGDRDAASRLLPMVYEDLRRQAAAKMRHEAAGHTLQPTALVHEAYVRLFGGQKPTFAS